MMKRPRARIGLAAAIMLAGVSLGWLAVSAGAQSANAGAGPPFDLSDPAHIREGAETFRHSCTGYCHGKEGGPARAPKLRGNKLEQSYIYGRIMGGSPNGMPAFGPLLPQEKIWGLVAYVMSLSKVEDK